MDKIDLKENVVKMMWPYYPVEPLTRHIDQLEKGRKFARAGGQTIIDAMMVSKGITLLAQTDAFNEDIREWSQHYTNLKTWESFKTFFHRAYREQRILLTISRKGRYTAVV